MYLVGEPDWASTEVKKINEKTKDLGFAPSPGKLTKNYTLAGSIYVNGEKQKMMFFNQKTPCKKLNRSNQLSSSIHGLATSNLQVLVSMYLCIKIYPESFFHKSIFFLKANGCIFPKNGRPFEGI
jgi:hypothetical protein